MNQPLPALRLRVGIFHFAYGGNGGVSSEHPDIREWELGLAFKLRDDPRVESCHFKTFCDTPVTLVRNRAIRFAKENGFHLALFVDSDQSPNKHAGESWFKPFWDEAFDFIYKNYGKGPHVVGAPYCGPPNGTENVYVFQWDTDGNKGEETGYSLEQYTRVQASMMAGIQECAALPTGMILIDLRACDLVEPVPHSKREILEQVQAGSLSVDDALCGMKEGYFYYEWKDQFADEKASTEDVTFTRDIAMAGMAKLGYNPIHCAWDSWVGHWKPWNVGKPRHYSTEHISATFGKAWEAGIRSNELILDLSRLNQGNDPLCRKIREMASDSHGYTPDVRALSPNGNGHHRNAAGTALQTISFHDGHKVRDIGTGEWYDHGHAADSQQQALQDIVRTYAYKRYDTARILEVGTWVGKTAVALADAAKSIVYCVDHFEGTSSDMMAQLADEAGGKEAIIAKFKENVGDRLDRTIFLCEGTSGCWSNHDWEFKFDMIFIDADHTYAAVKADILNWWKHLADDGVMVGHDFETHGHDGVTKAVHELFGGKAEAIGWHQQGCMWKVRKVDFPDGLPGQEACCGAQAVA